MTFDELHAFDRLYLGSPFRKYSAGMPLAAKHVAKLAARLNIAGIHAYSPIAHGYMMSIHGGIHPSANELWEKINLPWMAASDALLVAKMDGWENSDGLKTEIDYFTTCGKPVYYIDPISLLVSHAA